MPARPGIRGAIYRLAPAASFALLACGGRSFRVAWPASPSPARSAESGQVNSRTQQTWQRHSSRRFVVAIAPLRADTQDQMRRFIVRELRGMEQQLEVITVPQAPTKRGGLGSTATDQSEVGRILESSGADLLIWGQAITVGTEQRPSLFIVALRGART